MLIFKAHNPDVWTLIHPLLAANKVAPHVLASKDMLL